MNWSFAGDPTVMVTCALPLFPSDVAVMVAVPGFTPVASPVAPVTDAVAGSEDVQVTARPRRTLSSSSRSVAVSTRVVAAAVVEVAGVTATLFTGTSTGVTCAEADFPSMVAVTATGPPGVPPVMSPWALTETMPALALDQVTGRPVISRSCASKARAVSVLVRPTPTVAVAGSTATRATGTGWMERLADPSFPRTAAYTLTEPLARAVTNPVALTVATAGSPLRHCMEPTSPTWPAHEKAPACISNESPIFTVAVVGRTSIRATNAAAMASQSGALGSPPAHPVRSPATNDPSGASPRFQRLMASRCPIRTARPRRPRGPGSTPRCRPRRRSRPRNTARQRQPRSAGPPRSARRPRRRT